MLTAREIGDIRFTEISYRHWLIGQALASGKSCLDAIYVADQVLERLEFEIEKGLRKP